MPCSPNISPTCTSRPSRHDSCRTLHRIRQAYARGASVAASPRPGVRVVWRAERALMITRAMSTVPGSPGTYYGTPSLHLTGAKSLGSAQASRHLR
eukprot:4315387-Prymnesium_polylepis.1